VVRQLGAFLYFQRIYAGRRKDLIKLAQQLDRQVEDMAVDSHPVPSRPSADGGL
jgi:hypothetical protein